VFNEDDEERFFGSEALVTAFSGRRSPDGDAEELTV
jgi:hypothetical protein